MKTTIMQNGQKFELVVLNSPEDLPKTEGTYFGCRLGIRTVLEFTPEKSEISWLKEVQWYIKPIITKNIIKS